VTVTCKVALVSEVFFGEGAASRLDDVLGRVRALGVELAVLPELGLDPWVPCSRTPSDDDAEPVGGRREAMLRDAASRAGIAVVGGAIVRDAAGVRRNTALFVDAHGTIVASYAKVHVPQEPGFWERDHYADGDVVAAPFEHGGMCFGLQICSDIMRPVGVETLAARGAHVVLHPRATEPDTWDAWRCVMRAAGLTSGCWVLSVNRPRAEGGTPLGGPSCVIAPDGTIVLESTETIAIATVDAAAVTRAETDYPGYLPLRTDLYADAWSRARARSSRC
jgi:predicted amidohydrolase